MSRYTTALLMAAAALPAISASPPAHAFELWGAAFDSVRWTWGEVDFETVPVTLSDDDMDAIDAAADLWWRSAGNVAFDVREGDNLFSFGNGENEIARTCDAGLLNGAPAICWVIYDPFTGDLSEADIYVNDCYADAIEDTTQRSDAVAYGGDTRALVPVMLHEMGHALGLRHENDVYNVMGDDSTFVATNRSVLTYYVGADAGLGALALYGSGDASDVGVSHWKWVGESGEYSEHGRTAIYDDVGLLRPSELVDDEPVFKVWPGAGIEAEFTYEGNGVTAGAVEVGFYLSSNDFITTNDERVDTTTMVLLPGVVSTVSVPLVIPAGTAPGVYGLGPILFPTFTDEVSSNNATYVHIEVVDTWNACTPASPCGHREGDCDTNADCTDGTTCVLNVGANYGAAASLDVCERSLTAFCQDDLPCPGGVGDCDVAADCLSGVCLQNVGAAYGYASWVDVCL